MDKKIFAIQKENEKIIKRVCPEAVHQSGIYAFHRIDENGIKHGYIGLASKSLLTRLAQHLSGYKQHIDLSIKKYKLYDEVKNPYGYKVSIVCLCPPEELDEKEPYYIKLMSDKGYQLKNVQSGSRLQGRNNINEMKPQRGYRDGKEQGYKEAREEIAKLFEKNLTYSINGKPTKLKERALEKFEIFINKRGE